MPQIAADYRKELENTARLMILVHRVDILVKLILRTIVRILRIEHASLLLYDKKRDAYVAYVSRGKMGVKVPKGFTKIGKDDTLIRYFTDASMRLWDTPYLLLDILETASLTLSAEKPWLEDLRNEFLLYNARACIPGFYRDTLIFALFLGAKKDGSSYAAEELDFLTVLSSDAVMAIQNAWLFEDLSDQFTKNKNLFFQTTLALAGAIEAKDPYTQGHTARVAQYSLLLLEELGARGLVQRQELERLRENLRIAAFLHDIGKIGVPESILNKNGFLTESERVEIEKHPLIGVSILNNVDEFKEPILGVKYHHERFDGKGYPERLKGDQIPFIARIVAVADVYDAITTDRPYRRGLPKEQALAVIEQEKGKQFFPEIADAFIGALSVGKK